MKLTERFVRSIRADPERDIYYMDDRVPGYGVRARKAGKISYIFRYRIGGAQKIATIAAAAALQESKARELAKQMAGDVARGIDPQEEKRERRSMPLFRTWCQEYLSSTTNKRSIKDDEQKIRLVLIPELGPLPLDKITSRDVRRVLALKGREKIRAATGKGPLSPATRNRYRALLHVLFERAIEAKILPHGSNPVADIPVEAENNQRERYLLDAEWDRLHAALLAVPENARGAILACAVSGRRFGDVVGMRWQDVDLERKIWTIPRAKDNRAWHVHITPELEAILAAQEVRHIADNLYVFPARHGTGHLRSVQRAWEDARAAAGLEGFRMHDLRHNVASRIVQAGHTLQVVARLLGHTDLKTTQRYAHLGDQQVRDVAAMVAESLSKTTKAGRG